MSTDIVFYQKLGDEPMSWSPSLGVVFGIFCVGGGDDENGWGLGSWCWREMGLGGVVNCDLMMSESDVRRNGDDKEANGPGRRKREISR